MTSLNPPASLIASISSQGVGGDSPSSPLARVLVTGGTGFIGKNLLNRLSRMNATMCVAIRPGGQRRLPELPGMEVHEGAMHRANDWHPLLDGVDTVIHVAGATAGTQSELLKVNRDITHALSQAAATIPNPPRLIYVSSLSAAGPSERFHPRHPNDRPAPISDYGRSKYEGELAALAFADRVPTTIVRPGIVFGPGDKEVVRLLASIARFGINPMAGFHDPRIAFVHVEDLIDAIIASAIHGRFCEGGEPHNGDGRGVYFVADREFITFSQFAKYAASGLGRKRVFDLRIPLHILRRAAWTSERVGRWFGVSSSFNPDKIREASCPEWTCDVASTENELGWQPAIPLEQRVHQFASMYKAG